MVVGSGNDPLSQPYQDCANPSQLTDHEVEHRAGFKPAVGQFCRLLPWIARPPMRE